MNQLTQQLTVDQAVKALKAHGIEVISSTHGKHESICVRAVYCRNGKSFDVIEEVKPAEVRSWLGY